MSHSDTISRSSPEMFPARRSPAILACLAFLMAFCSLCYEILIASRLSFILGEGIFIYPAAIGLFLLGMGIGSAVWSRREETDSSKVVRVLFRVEISLTLCGLFSLFLIDVFLTHTLPLPINPILFGLFEAGLIGFLSGQELPLIFHLASIEGIPSPKVRQIIFWDYLASFAASLALSLLLFPGVGLFPTSVLTAALNLVIVLGLTGLAHHDKIPLTPILRRMVVLSFLLVGTTLFFLSDITLGMIKFTIFIDRPAVTLASFQTPYQEVRLFLTRKDTAPIEGPPPRLLQRDDPGVLLIGLLNGAVQFIEPMTLATDKYHACLIAPFVELLDAKDVLILGGGDGLPAREAVRHRSIRRITMVDIDEDWVTFTKTDPFMRRLSKSSLDDPRITIHFQDAFKWVSRTTERYDAIFIDFPEEENLAALRTISLQFFRDLKRILKDEGVAVLQDGIPLSDRLIRHAWRTALAADLRPLFGTNDDFSDYVTQLALFKTAAARDRYLEGYRETFFSKDNPDPWKDLARIHYRKVTPADHWISYYDPRVLRLTWSQIRRVITAFSHAR